MQKWKISLNANSYHPGKLYRFFFVRKPRLAYCARWEAFGPLEQLRCCKKELMRSGVVVRACPDCRIE